MARIFLGYKRQPYNQSLNLKKANKQANKQKKGRKEEEEAEENKAYTYGSNLLLQIVRNSFTKSVKELTGHVIFLNFTHTNRKIRKKISTEYVVF